VNETLYSPEVARQLVWLSGLLPYAQATAVCQRIGHRQVPSTSIWQQAQRHGERLRTYVARQQTFVGVERVVLPPPGQDHAGRKGVSMDGGMVNIRGEGWKEMKVGTVFDIEQRLERDPVTRELVERPHGVNMTYAAVLGAPEQFAPALWTLAVDHKVPTAREACVVADGASWIWNVAADYFPDESVKNLTLLAKSKIQSGEGRYLGCGDWDIR
jgi:hypothetical protein